MTRTTETTAELHPIFQACCADKPTWFDMETPWVTNGWLYATNGQIIVRIPSREREPDATGKRPKAPVELFLGEFDTKPALILETDYPDKADCNECSFGTCTCPRCDTEHDCGNCDGTGQVLNRVLVAVVKGNGQQGFQAKHLNLLRRHGVTELYLATNPDRAAKFSVGDIEGRLMPMPLTMPRKLLAGDT